MPLIARQRSRLAVLAVLALVGSLLAVSAVPAVAATDDEADEKATYSACVGAATESAGFSDMGNSFAADAANCLAHYGITVGTGDGTFSPEAAVTRLAMARFLYRAAGPAGIDTMMVTDQNLTDSDSKEVNTVVSLGIMTPRSEGVFDPSGLVSRKDMAVHLVGFLSKAIQGPGSTSLDKLQSKNGLGSGKSPFTDIGEVSVSAHQAIRDVFELGITTGTTTTTFSPDSFVTRAQMAAFITRALAHTNARPAGISAQAAAGGDTGQEVPISVSVRDEDHGVVPDALVGRIHTTTPDTAFDDSGECDKATGDCALNTGNEATDPDGNAELEVTLPEKAGTLTVWVWTGESGDKFDADTTGSTMLEIDAALPATTVKVSNDNKAGSQFLKFGDTVTYTLQVVNAEGDPVAKADAKVQVTADIQTVTVAAENTPALSDNAVTATQGGVSSRTIKTHETDAAGRIELSFTHDDPDGDKAGNRVQLILALVLTVDGDLDEVSTMDLNDHLVAASDFTDTETNVGVNNLGVIWSDAASRATTITLGQATKYHETNANGVRNTVTATLVDQYGDPIRGVKVALWSGVTNTAATATTAAILQGLGGATDAQAGSATNVADRRTTNRNGVATKSYTRNVVGATQEQIGASYAAEVGCDDDEATCDETDDIAITITETATDGLNHYWATRLGVGPVTGQGVLVADVDNNTVVVGTATSPTLTSYDANDHFQLGGANTTMEEFEKALGGADANDTMDITITSAADNAINTFNFVAVA
jgi:hypothetical protein